MKRTKGKALAMLLVAGILCTGTVTVYAETLNRVIGTYTLTAECTISSTLAMARTLSNGRDVFTRVSATYYYTDSVQHEFYHETESDSGYYGSDVAFSAPTDCYSYDISAVHEATYETEYWQGTTFEKIY